MSNSKYWYSIQIPDEWDINYSNPDFVHIFPNNNNKKGDSGNLFFYIGGRYLYGTEAVYLKEGDIEFSDPEDGPVESTFNWNQSKTDLLQINIGIGIKLK